MAERNAMEARKCARVVFWIKNNVPNQNKPQQSHRRSYSENTCGAQKNATAVTPPQWWMTSCIIFSLALNVSRSSAHHLVATMQAWCRDFPKKRTGSSDCWWYTKRCGHVWVRPWMRIEALHVKESVQFMKNICDGKQEKRSGKCWKRNVKNSRRYQLQALQQKYSVWAICQDPLQDASSIRENEHIAWFCSAIVDFDAGSCLVQDCSWPLPCFQNGFWSCFQRR